MNNENFNDNDMPNFVLPESFLNQLFEFSGSTDGNRGFILAFVNQEGSPMIYTKSDNQIIEMGLRKAIERYILDSEEAESYNGNDPI
jgi:hypothetical protein